MKRFVSFLMASFLAACLTIPAFAAENPAVYDASFVPPIPDFIREYSDWYYGNGTQITCGFTGKLGFDYGSYPQDDVFPVVVLLSQGRYDKYKEENGIDYDREYSLYYILLRKYHGAANDYSLGSFLHKGGPQHTMFMGSGNCMQYVLNSNFEYSFIKMDYNWEGGYFESNEDMHHVSQGSLSFFPFAYHADLEYQELHPRERIEKRIRQREITNAADWEYRDLYPEADVDNAVYRKEVAHDANLVYQERHPEVFKVRPHRRYR